VTEAAAAARPAPITGAADILCDRSGRVGLLSYQVPAGMRVVPGDAVQVPFGKRTAYGMVVRAGDPAKATRAIEQVYGKRAAPADLALAASIAKFHFADVNTVYSRLAPPSGRGADPLQDHTVTLDDTARATAARIPAATTARRLLVRAPLIDPAALAAAEAARLAADATGDGDRQVLVLCPTADLVTAVLEHLPSGAQRLDTKAPKGAWKGFILGTVRIGIGTRAAALYSAPHLAGIVVVDEDHPGHLEARQPHTHARDIASARSRALRIPLTLISAAPSPQALGCGVTVTTIGTRADWPRMRLVDRRDHDPVMRWAPPPLKAALSAHQRAGGTPVVVVQRTTALRRCRRCGLPRPCTDCTSSLCRHLEPSPCPQCASTDGVRMAGWDAARVTDLLGPGIRTVTLADLAGISDAGLVVLFDVDAALAAAELIPGTLAQNLIVTAARAAGRGGTVLALTESSGHELLADLFGPRDQLAPARRALAAAKEAGLPPFGRLVSVRVGQDRKPDTSRWPGTVHGPRRAGTEWEALVRIGSDQLLELGPHLARLRRAGKARITVT